MPRLHQLRESVNQTIVIQLGQIFLEVQNNNKHCTCITSQFSRDVTLKNSPTLANEWNFGKVISSTASSCLSPPIWNQGGRIYAGDRLDIALRYFCILNCSHRHHSLSRYFFLYLAFDFGDITKCVTF